jgi:TRAP-type transport system periplasmic protein
LACSGSSDKAGGSTDDENAVVLTLADQSQGPIDIQVWIDEVERLSRGSVSIDVRSRWRGGSPDAERETIADVQAGRVDLAKIGAGAWSTVGVPNFDPLVAPLLIDSYELERKVLESGIVRRALAGAAEVGLVGLAVVPGPLERPIGITQPLLGRRQYEAATIGVRPGRQIQRATIEALGGRGEPLVPGASVRSFDGLVFDLESVKFDGYDRFASAVTANVNLWPAVTTIVMNRAAFEALSARQQDLLLEAGVLAVPKALDLVRLFDRDAAGVLCRRGVSFARATRQDLDALRTAVQPVYDEILRDRTGRSLLRGITGMKERLGIVPSLGARCASAPGVASPVVTRVDGVYRTSFTRDDLVQSPLLMDAGEINDENWGDFTLTLDRGGVTFTQRNDRKSTSTSGTFTVKGDVLSLRFTTGVNAGETFAFRWSLYRGTLEFERDETLGVAPTPYLVKPWRRVR